MKYPNLNEEKKLWKSGFNFVVGLDEAGRGPLAGPVVAGAVLINCVKSDLTQFKIMGVDDSKKLSEKQRENLYKILTHHPNIKWGVGIVSEKIIDKINILEASKLAMKKAVENLARSNFYDRENLTTLDFLLIDGNFSVQGGPASGWKFPEKSIIKGDSKVFSIACASIIAKVTRDRIMEKYHKKYPEYGFAKHKGYGTKSHFASLKKFGPCKIHRKTFYPVCTYLQKKYN
jgi:ribonuclease HII